MDVFIHFALGSEELRSRPSACLNCTWYSLQNCRDM